MKPLNQQNNMQPSNQMPPQMNHGGHELMDAQETIGAVIGCMEQYVLYEGHTQDAELLAMNQRHRQFLSQMYNTMVDTLKTGQDPMTPTQSYQMEQANDITYGLQASAPKSPAQSVNNINDECISGFMIGGQKGIASALTASALEATNPVLRRVFADSIPNVIEMAYEIFLYQNKNQYYQVPQLSNQDMQILTNQYAPVSSPTQH